MKPRHTFSVSVELWLRSDMYIWVSFSWVQGILSVKVWGPYGTLSKEQSSPEIVSDYRAKRARF